jgi:hypothetical protein
MCGVILQQGADSELYVQANGCIMYTGFMIPR